jgi:hypothetical protein
MYVSISMQDFSDNSHYRDVSMTRIMQLRQWQASECEGNQLSGKMLPH